MAESELLRLQRIAVDRLFGTYDHDIHLKLEDRVTLLHGPNGVGKTVVLGMVDALLRRRLGYIRGIPFSRFFLEFRDGSTVEVAAAGQESGDGYELRLFTQGQSHSASLDELSPAGRIAAKIEYLRPHSRIADAWIDMRDDEVLDASDVVSRYSEGDTDGEQTSWFDRFLGHARAHFIEAQRLMRTDLGALSRFGYRRTLRREPPFFAVDECSEHFRRRIADTMVQYGRESQTLDLSFPQRLISATDELAVDELKQRMSELDRKTEELKRIGVLDETPTHPFPVDKLGDMDAARIRVMTLYVQDTEGKLQVLDDLAKRVHVLLDNVNQKYRHKKIALDREHGLVARSDIGQVLALRALSSGEQQELVLHYDLLFRVRSNTIVLVDEPELSLHVAWQKRFLPDLLRIVELSNFDALVATHSPYVVGDRDDLMVALGDSA